MALKLTMTRGRALAVGIPAAVLALCLAGSFLTRGAMANLPFLRGQGAGANGPGGSNDLVDQSPWDTVAALAPLAVSSEEQRYAHVAERLADHEVDQAFAMALRQAAMETPVLNARGQALQKQIAELSGVVKEDQARVDGLTAKVATVKAAAAKKKDGAVQADAVDDDLDSAKAQLQLDSDELSDAQDNLQRASGDKRSQIQQELTTRQEAMKKYDASQQSGGGQTATVSAKQFQTLAGRVGAWFDQRSRRSSLEQAQRQAVADTAALTKQQTQLEAKLTAADAAMKAQATGQSGGAPDESARMKALGSLHGLAQVRSILEDRIRTQKQLATIYGRWMAQVDLQHKIVLHLMLVSLAWMAGIVLFGMLAWWGMMSLLDRSTMDRRSLHTLRTIASLAIQLMTLAMVLLVIFGAPSQVPTILGLGVAGITVAFQDFILAFFGWFVLMGKNGVRVGDWVEINGISGEVAEIGLFRTVLLETGNWTDNGHPTGRRVTFINNFAISGQYFNFSTSGQWMWDEITVNVPAGEDSYKTIQQIHEAVVKATEADTEQAENEWQGVAKLQGVGQFAAAPSVDMRPAASGVDVLVRYVTRAGNRFEARNKLYQTVVQILGRAPVEKGISK